MTTRRPVAVITGGTHGIGRHTLGLLGRAGWSVAICSRSADESERVAREAAAELGVAAIGLGVDVRSFEELQQFASHVTATLGPPDVVIANAGVLGPVGPLHLLDMAAWARAVEIDLMGVAFTWSAFAAQMIAHDVGGHLITMSGGGVGGHNMAPAISAYTTSKAAVVALTETVSMEMFEYGIAVNAIAPGAIATRFTEPLLAAGRELAGDRLFAETQRQLEQPDSLAHFDRLLISLLDPSSTFVTGRLLSARWDDPTKLAENAGEAGSSRYRLRRIDRVLFDEVMREPSA